MKKLLNIAVLLALVVSIAGCRDAGYDVKPLPTFEIVDAEVSFPASGGEGTIAIELLKSGTPTVSVEKDWCKATLSGNKVIINVEPNKESQSRETALTIEMKGYTRTFGIFQNGIYYYIGEDFGQLGCRKDDELRIPLTIEGEMTLGVDTCSKWVDARIDGNDLVIKALTNNDLAPRSGFVTLEAGVQKKTVNFTQTEFPLEYDAFLGDWKFTYYATYNGNYTEKDVSFVVKEEGKSLTLIGLPYPIDMDFNDGEVRFDNCPTVGTYLDGTTNRPVTLRMMSNTGSTSTTRTYYFYSTYEVIDAKLVLTINTKHTSGTSYIGFAFSPGTGLTPLYTYYPDIKMYKK